jgi:polyhydroxybutyrate depolymerase
MHSGERVLACLAALAAFITWNGASAQSCSIAPAALCQSQGDFLTRTITIEDGGPGGNDIARQFNVHCPNVNDEPTGAIPLVLMLHGGYGNPDDFARDTLAQEFSDNTHANDLGEFFLVMPAALTLGDGAQWNNRFDDLADPHPTRADDLKFVDDLLDCLISEYDGTDPPWTIDTSRIYAAGMSDGAGMVNRLAVDITDRLAAVASVSGRLAFVYDETYNAGIGFTPNRFMPPLHHHQWRPPLARR